MSQVSSRVVVVTGGTKGIGLAIAQRFATPQHKLVIGYGGDRQVAEKAVADLRALGAAEVLLVQGDLRRAESAASLFKNTIESFGQPDVVFANAGVEIIDKPVAEMTEADFDRVVDLNFKGMFFTLQEAARHVNDGGRIIATSSTIAVYPPAKAAVYAATKAAVRTLVEVLSKELGPRGVTVNSLAPGAVAGAGIFTHISAEVREHFVESTPLGRMASPTDVGGAAVFLASVDAGFVSGHHLGVTGGATV